MILVSVGFGEAFLFDAKLSIEIVHEESTDIFGYLKIALQYPYKTFHYVEYSNLVISFSNNFCKRLGYDDIHSVTYHRILNSTRERLITLRYIHEENGKVYDSIYKLWIFTPQKIF